MRQSADLLSGAPPSPELHTEIEPLAAEWDALADRVGAPPFLRPGWCGAWLAAFGDGSPEILVVRRAGRLVAVLPLTRRRGVVRSASNWHTPVFDALTEPGEEADLADALLARPARRVTLAFVDPAAPLLVACRQRARAQGRRTLTRIVERSPYLDIDCGWDEFESSRLSRKRRGNLRTRRRRLMAEGGLAVEVSDGRPDLAGRLAECMAVEQRSWKGEAGTAIGSQEDTRRFYTDVARWAADRGFLRLAFLRVGGTPAAADYALECDGVHYMLKGSFDPAYAGGAPGTLLRAEMLARAFARGIERYEFGGQNEDWKRLWTDTWHDRAVMQIFAPGAVGLLGWSLHTRGRAAARRLRALARR